MGNIIDDPIQDLWRHPLTGRIYDLNTALRRRNKQSNENPIITVSAPSPSANKIINYAQMVYAQNDAIEKWIPKVRRALRSSARWFTNGKTDPFVLRDHGNQRETKLAESIGSYTKKNPNAIYKIAFKFERHGVFVHKGVGRGYKANGSGFVNRIATKSTKHQRVAIEWFNPTLDQYLPELANRIAEINADAVINATAMRIL